MHRMTGGTEMIKGRSVVIAHLVAAAGLLAFAGPNQSAQAQSIFCPSAIPQQSGIALGAGTCTNNTTGAFSNAALASEALSDLAQSTTQQASVTVGAALSARRQIELDRCPEGFERINGMCQRIVAGEPVTAAPASIALEPAADGPFAKLRNLRLPPPMEWTILPAMVWVSIGTQRSRPSLSNSS